MNIWQMFPKLTERVWRDHTEEGMLDGHHDPEHAVRVGQMALEIAEGPAVGRLAGAAGLVHNADRILQKKLGIGRRDAPRVAVANLVMEQLRAESGVFGPADVAAIVDAVLKHDGKNNNDGNPVLVALQDADRLVNSEPDLLLRAGQFYHDLPAVDPVHLDRDPAATYRDPRSVLRDVAEVIDWLTPGTPVYVRLPKARELARERRKFLRYFIGELVAIRGQTGFYPYPPELFALREKFRA